MIGSREARPLTRWRTDAACCAWVSSCGPAQTGVRHGLEVDALTRVLVWAMGGWLEARPAPTVIVNRNFSQRLPSARFEVMCAGIAARAYKSHPRAVWADNHQPTVTAVRENTDTG